VAHRPNSVVALEKVYECVVLELFHVFDAPLACNCLEHFLDLFLVDRKREVSNVEVLGLNRERVRGAVKTVEHVAHFGNDFFVGLHFRLSPVHFDVHAPHRLAGQKFSPGHCCCLVILIFDKCKAPVWCPIVNAWIQDDFDHTLGQSTNFPTNLEEYFFAGSSHWQRNYHEIYLIRCFLTWYFANVQSAIVHTYYNADGMVRTNGKPVQFNHGSSSILKFSVQSNI